VVAGEVDFLGTYGVLKDIPLYKENEQEGGYRTLLANYEGPSTVWLNLTHPDPVWRKVVNDVRFRRALSLGINREEIIDAVYLGFAEPTTRCGAYSVYDPAKAKQLLDEMGLIDRDGDGWRDGPDGKTFVIPFTQTSIFADLVPTVELVAEHWKALGIKTTIKPVNYGLYWEMHEANKVKATAIDCLTPELWRDNIWDILDDCIFGNWGQLWYRWVVTNGKKGEEPPEEVKKLLSLVDKSYEVCPGTAESKKIWDEVENLFHENVWVPYIVDHVKIPVIVPAKSNFADIHGAPLRVVVTYAAEQMFFRQ